MTANLLTVAGNHLLQSTVFAVLIWLITLLFRRNAASVRHALWVAASLKFLVPFTLLTVLGGYIQWPAAESASVARRVTMTMIDFNDKRTEFKPLEKDEVYPSQSPALNFIDTILGRAVNGSPGEFGLASMEIIDSTPEKLPIPSRNFSA